MKTIAIFAAYTNPHLGGIETYIDNLVKELKKTYNIIIVTSNFNDSSNNELVDGITYIRLPIYNCFKNRYPVFKHNKLFKNQLKLLNKYDITAIIVNTRFHLTSHIGANFAKKKNIPCLLIEHGSDYITVNSKFWDFFANKYEDYLTCKIKNKVSGIYGVSKRCNEWLKKIKINASGVFYNSIDEKIYNDNKKYIKSDKYINITYAGRIIPEKGIINLLEAFSGIKNDNCILNIAGDGPILDELKIKYINKNIKFLGKLSHGDVIKLLAKTDIFVYPSMYPEGLPTSILEAGIMKCAVLATDRGGTKEVIISDDYGIIIEENVKDLIDKLNYLISNEMIMKKMKNNLHDRILNNFVWSKTAETVIKEIKKYE